MDKVIVPKKDLEELERARLLIYEICDTASISKLMQLTDITAIMWKVANTKYPEYKNE